MRITRPTRATAVVGATLLLVGLGFLVGYGGIQSGRPVVLPAPTGPYQVGRTIYDWTDRSRRDPFASHSSTVRELAVLVWYPADPAVRASATSYLPPGWEEALNSGGGVANAFAGLGHTSPALVHPHAVEDAAVARDGSRYPLVVFSPGLGLQASDYTTLAEDLASRGYVVAGINPTYSTDVVLSGGRVVRSVARAGNEADYGALVKVWADDMRFVAGELRALDTAPGGRFQGRLEVSRIGFFGHSAGGAAATLACRHDDLCPGAVDIDGDLAGDVVETGLGKPFLFLGHPNAFSREPYLKGMLRSVLHGVPAGQGHVLTVVGAGHDTFTDRSLYFNFYGPQHLAAMGGMGGARLLSIVRACLRWFFDVTLREEPSPIPSFGQVRQQSL